VWVTKCSSCNVPTMAGHHALPWKAMCTQTLKSYSIEPRQAPELELMLMSSAPHYASLLMSPAQKFPTSTHECTT
jgi:hypothetical protein